MIRECWSVLIASFGLIVQYIRDTIFAHFVSSECGQQSVAVALNPSQIDFAPPFTMSGVSWFNVQSAAKLYLSTMDTTPSECLEVCDSYSFAMVMDEDGSLTGVANSVVIGENPALSFPSPVCTSVLEWGGLMCRGIKMRAATLSSQKEDATKKVMSTIQISRVDPLNPSAFRKYFAHGPYKDMCPDIMPDNRFRFLLVPGYEHEVIATNMLPDRFRFNFWSENTSESVLMKVFMGKPQLIDMFVDGGRVERSTGDVPTLADPAGTNLLNPQGVCDVVCFCFCQ
jgi:hypothetical protein